MTSFKNFACGGISVLLAGALSLAVAQTSSSSSSMKSSQSSATSSKSSASDLSATDRHFVRKAAEGGLAEVELGKLATEKASSEEVKKFGQRMVDDHSKANDQLKEIASSKGINLPTQPSPQEKADAARLSKLSGTQFDQAYMAEMRKDHKKDVSEFRLESKTGHDSEIKNFATQTLPTLQDHMKQAEGTHPAKTSQRSALDKSATPEQ